MCNVSILHIVIVDVSNEKRMMEILDDRCHLQETVPHQATLIMGKAVQAWLNPLLLYFCCARPDATIQDTFYTASVDVCLSILRC